MGLIENIKHKNLGKSQSLKFLIAVFALAYLLKRAVSGIEFRQEDFRLFLASAEGALKGVNPYDNSKLAQAVPTPETQALNWFYPPHLLSFFGLFLKMPLPLALRAWQLSKALAASWVLFLWWRWYGKRVGLLLFLGVVLFSFRAPFVDDLSAGNVSIWEQLFFWCGVALLNRKSAFLAGVFFFLALQWKLTLGALCLGVVLFSSQTPRRKLRALFGMAGSAMLAICWSLKFYPGLLSAFTENLLLHSRTDTADRSWDGTHFSSLYNLNYLTQNPQWALALWVALVSFVLITLCRTRWSRVEPHLGVAFLAVSYALCVPRLKLYSLAMMIPALFEAICLAKKNALLRSESPFPKVIVFWVCITGAAVTFGGTSMNHHDLLHRLYNLRFLSAGVSLWALLLFETRKPGPRPHRSREGDLQNQFLPHQASS